MSVAAQAGTVEPATASSPHGSVEDFEEAMWERTCFYSAPIRRPRSKQRRHSNVFLESLVRPAIETLDLGMSVVRADELPSNLVVGSVYKHVIRSRLMIADLSFHNASVMVEVGMRLLSGKPCVLLCRAADDIPADLQEMRVIQVHTSQFFEFAEEEVAKREEIATNVRWALSPEGRGSSPVQRLVPDYRGHLD